MNRTPGERERRRELNDAATGTWLDLPCGLPAMPDADPNAPSCPLPAQVAYEELCPDPQA